MLVVGNNGIQCINGKEVLFIYFLLKWMENSSKKSNSLGDKAQLYDPTFTRDTVYL